jgi:hypothetical protein
LWAKPGRQEPEPVRTSAAKSQLDKDDQILPNAVGPNKLSPSKDSHTVSCIALESRQRHGR